MKIDTDRCEELGKAISRIEFNKDSFQNTVGKGAEDEHRARAFLYAAGICHQTHSLINRRLNLKGWEFLTHVFGELAVKQSDLIDPFNILESHDSDIISLLKPLFAEDGDPSHCTLDDLERRVRFMKGISEFLIDDYHGKVIDLIARSDGYLINSGTGLYELLEGVEAFSDPMRKKTTVFLGLLEGAGMYAVKDPEHFEPPMDYHKQRLLMRTGCVEVLDNELKRKLCSKEKLDSEDEIRYACKEAMKEIIINAGHNTTGVDYLLWAIGRSCCKIKILCVDGSCTKDPCTATVVADISDHSRCLLEKVCKGRTDPEYRKFWQPIVDTHYH